VFVVLCIGGVYLFVHYLVTFCGDHHSSLLVFLQVSVLATCDLLSTFIAIVGRYSCLPFCHDHILLLRLYCRLSFLIPVSIPLPDADRL
jgi:hypothetical protein